MPNNQKRNSPVGFNKKSDIQDLQVFKENLEKIFFSKPNIRVNSTKDSLTKLTIELNCNYSLIEMLDYFNTANWGNFESNTKSFENLLLQLQNSNDTDIEVEELSIFLKDTSLIINTIYNQSIPEQLQNILKEVGNHYIYFTDGLNKIPYEIHVPVFEEKYPELQDSKKIKYTKNDFLSYWGVYFYDDDDAIIYDLKNSLLISGNLQMLNRD